MQMQDRFAWLIDSSQRLADQRVDTEIVRYQRRKLTVKLFMHSPVQSVIMPFRRHILCLRNNKVLKNKATQFTNFSHSCSARKSHFTLSSQLKTIILRSSQLSFAADGGALQRS